MHKISPQMLQIRFIDPQKEAVLKVSEELSEHSNSSVFADGLIKFESALLIDSMRMFHQALTGLESVESKTIECQSADYMEHGHTLVNMIKTVSFIYVCTILQIYSVYNYSYRVTTK